MRFPRALVLMAVVGLSTHITADIVGQTGVAQAADFTGRIKRIRVKKRKTGSLYRLVTVTSPADAVGFELFGGPLGDEVLTIDVDEPTRTTIDTRIGVSALTDLPIGQWSHVTVTHRSTSLTVYRNANAGENNAEDAVTFDVPLCESEPCEDVPVGTAELPDGTKVTAQIDATGSAPTVELTLNGRRRMPTPQGGLSVVVNEAPEPGTGGATVGDELDVSYRWTADVERDVLGDGGFMTGAVTTYGSDGEVLNQTSASGMVYTDTTEAEGLQSAAVVQRADGSFRLRLDSVSTDSDATPSHVVVRTPSGQVVADADPRDIGTVGIWTTQGLSFPDDPNDFTYAVMVSSYSASGELLAEHDAEVVVGSEPMVVDPGGELGLRKVQMVIEDDETVSVGLSLDGALATEVASVQLNFEEPFEGPEPDELEVMLEGSAVWTRSRTTFNCDDCSAETPFEVEVTTGPDAGETTTFAATAGINGFGSGTKKSTTRTSSQTPQLQ